MEEKTSLLKKLILEMQKENRSFLYDLSDRDYKNNRLKQIVWNEIAEALELTKDQVQSLWKRTRSKYKMALAKANAPSGSGARKQNAMDTFLLKELEFLQPYVEDKEPTTTNYSDSNTEDVQLFDELILTDPEVFECSLDESSSTPLPSKKRKTITGEIEGSLKRLENLASEIVSSPNDPFYPYFQSEMEKLPDDVKAKLKSLFMQKIYEAQQNHTKSA